MRRLLSSIAALLCLAPSWVAAQDVGLRATPTGIDQLTTVARGYLPETFQVPALDRQLFNCPGSGDIVAHVPDTDVQIGWHELSVRTEDGAVVVDTVIDVDVATPLDIDHAYACLNSASCDVTASARSLGVEVELAAATGPDGGVEFHGATVGLDLTADDLDIMSEGCLVGDVAEWLINAVEAWALDLLLPRLEAMASEQVSGVLTDVMGETLALSIEQYGFSIDASVQELELSRRTGLTLGGDAVVRWAGASRWHEDAPSVRAPEGDALPDDFDGMFQVAASDRLVNEALFEAWRGGLISQLLADNQQSIALGTLGAAQQIGLPPGTRLEVTADIERPLEATFGREDRDVATIAVRDLHVMIDVLDDTGDAPSHFDLFVDATASAALTMNPEVNGLVLDFHDLIVDQLRLEASGHLLELDPARLRRFVANTVHPLLADRLRELPVAPAVQPVLGTYLHVVSLESDRGWQRVGIDLHIPDPNDRVAPDTALIDPANLLPAGTARFSVSGHDDSTPDDLLRYRAWLDGEPLGDGTASSLREVRFDATDGEHTLEVAAVDLNDNEDRVPAIHGFVVDGTPPDLRVYEAPGSIVADPIVRVAWTATDTRSTNLESRFTLRRLREDGTSEIVEEAPFTGDQGVAEIAASSLEGHDLYEIEIEVRDEAGNVTSEAFGFALHPSLYDGGCSVGGPGSRAGSSVAPLALAFAMFLVARRRRSRG
ncbi:MAG: hypothetical protein AB7S26_13470 [Sandaracinaceae bacterium]